MTSSHSKGARGLVAFFAFLVLLGVVAWAVTDPQRGDVPYSAFRTIAGPGPGRAGWVYHDDGKERFERVMAGHLRIFIRRPDLGRAYIIDPATGSGFDLQIDDPRVDFSFWPEALRMKPQGQETLDGETVWKHVIVDRYNNSRTYWLTDDGIPLRIETTLGAESMTIRLIELRRGPQPAHLFEVPDGTEMTVNPKRWSFL